MSRRQMSEHYPLPPFRCEDPEKIKALIRHSPLATLISIRGEWPLITQIPLLLEQNSLVGHLDANNPQIEALRANPRVTCLFHGPNHYITPTIYPEEHYPGWNYATVHIRAKAREIEDIEQIRSSLFALAEAHEPADSGYRLKPSQRNFELFSTQIRGFEFQILEAKGIFKLAQDKGEGNARLAGQHLCNLVRPNPSELLEQLLR